MYIIVYTCQFQHYEAVTVKVLKQGAKSRRPSLNLSHIQILRVYGVRKATLCNDKSKTSLKYIQMNLREQRELHTIKFMTQKPYL